MKEYISIDIGNWKVKTATGVVFDNGITQMEVRPSVQNHSGRYNGKWFKAEEGRKRLSSDWLSDDTYAQLVCVAIAKDLSKEKKTSGKIILVLGCPFSVYSIEEPKLINYFKKRKTLDFIYEDIEYHINVDKVLVYPQCFAAIAPRLGNMQNDRWIAVDIGSKTVDAVMFENAIPIESSSTTFELGTIKGISFVRDELRRIYDKDYPEASIERALMGEKTALEADVLQTIKQTAVKYMEKIVAELVEREFDVEYSTVIFLGGGSVWAKRYLPKKSNYLFESNICANAEGYDFLAKVQEE